MRWNEIRKTVRNFERISHAEEDPVLFFFADKSHVVGKFE